MRRIKFRAWNIKAKQMVYYDKDCSAPDLTLNGVLINHITQTNVSNKYILMQFTGLHDKNGKEIYEGDIIRDATSSGYTKWWDGIVTWHDAGSVGWVAEPLPENKHRGAWGLNYNYEYEVIGNVHENPLEQDNG